MTPSRDMPRTKSRMKSFKRNIATHKCRILDAIEDNKIGKLLFHLFIFNLFSVGLLSNLPLKAGALCGVLLDGDFAFHLYLPPHRSVSTGWRHFGSLWKSTLYQLIYF